MMTKKKVTRHFSVAEKEKIFNVFKTYEAQHPDIGKTDGVRFTASATGTSVCSVFRILREHKDNEGFAGPSAYQRRKAVLDNITEEDKNFIRQKVHSFLTSNQPPTVSMVLEAVNQEPEYNFKRTTFWKLLKMLNFSIKEQKITTEYDTQSEQEYVYTSEGVKVEVENERSYDERIKSHNGTSEDNSEEIVEQILRMKQEEMFPIKRETENEQEHLETFENIKTEYDEMLKDMEESYDQTKSQNGTSEEESDEIVNQEMSEMDWTNETTMRFLKLYQMHPCIWNPKNVSYKNRMRRNEAWIMIKNSLGESFTVKELKKKKQNLMSAYRGYRCKIKKKQTLGYKPIWFAYSLMDSFLGTLYKCTLSTTTTEENQNQQHIVDSNNDDSSGLTTFEETPTSIKDQNIPSHTLQHGSAKHASSSSTVITSKRTRNNFPEVQNTEKPMDTTFNIVKTISQHHLDEEEEDECCIFGKLIAKKLRKLSEDRRDLMMLKINKLFYKEWHERHTSDYSS